MNKSLLAVATAALFLGSIGAASAQSTYQPPYGDDASYGYTQSYDPNYDSRDDGRYDERGDSRYDERYDERDDPRYDDRYDNRDARRDDRYDGRGDGRSRHDRDCDGISDRYVTPYFDTLKKYAQRPRRRRPPAKEIVPSVRKTLSGR